MMSENTSHDDDLTLEESESAAVVGGGTEWEPVACTETGTEYRNPKTGATKFIKAGVRR